jgi:hypothetical protein
MNQIFSSIINPIKFVWKALLLDNEGFGLNNINNDSEINMGIIP